MDDLYEKGAFVTGAASGIGLAIATACAQHGMKVMLADVDAEALESAMEELADRDIDVMSTVCDVADPASVEAAAQHAIRSLGRVHLLVNNAGVATGGPLHEVALADWDWILGVNLKGVIHGIHHFLPHMLGHGDGGHVVNTASMAGMIAMPGLGPYNATKFAVVALSETLRAELAERGIGVSVLCPGWVRTRIHESGRTRPAAFGGPVQRVRSAQGEQIAAAIQAGMPAERVADLVLDAVRQDKPYIFTHADMAPMVHQRMAGIAAALDALK